jgi:hypothetical protein
MDKVYTVSVEGEIKLATTIKSKLMKCLKSPQETEPIMDVQSFIDGFNELSYRIYCDWSVDDNIWLVRIGDLDYIKENF